MAVATAERAAPTAAKDIWPSDTWPAHPVSTTIETPIRPNTSRLAASNCRSTDMRWGATMAPTTSTRTPPHLATSTSGKRRSSAGMVRTSSTADQLVAVSCSARVSPTRRTTSARMITTPSTGYTTFGLFPLFQITPCSRTPSATAAAVMAGRLVRRPTIRAVSADASAARLAVLTAGSPTTPARRNSPMKLMTVARDHTSICRVLTGMPRRDARSARSAEARRAAPTIVRRRNTARAMTTSGATTMAMASLAVKSRGPMVKSSLNGACTLRLANAFSLPAPVAEFTCFWRNSSSPITVKSWERPMVATVRMRRGARKKRRMIRTSTSAPTASAATSPMPSPRK